MGGLNNTPCYIMHLLYFKITKTQSTVFAFVKLLSTASLLTGRGRSGWLCRFDLAGVYGGCSRRISRLLRKYVNQYTVEPPAPYCILIIILICKCSLISSSTIFSACLQTSPGTISFVLMNLRLTCVRIFIPHWWRRSAAGVIRTFTREQHWFIFHFPLMLFVVVLNMCNIWGWGLWCRQTAETSYYCYKDNER